MSQFDDDDRPTVIGGQPSRGGYDQERETRAAGQSARGQAASRGFEDRQTIVQPRGPEINSVAWLYCRKGLRKGQLYQLRKARNEFGGAPNLDVTIEDGFASSHHGAVLLEEGAWKLFDFASTNGTRINDMKIGTDAPNPSVLNDGDVVTIGDTELVFKKI